MFSHLRISFIICITHFVTLLSKIFLRGWNSFVSNLFFCFLSIEVGIIVSECLHVLEQSQLTQSVWVIIFCVQTLETLSWWLVVAFVILLSVYSLVCPTLILSSVQLIVGQGFAEPDCWLLLVWREEATLTAPLFHFPLCMSLINRRAFEDVLWFFCIYPDPSPYSLHPTDRRPSCAGFLCFCSF